MNNISIHSLRVEGDNSEIGECVRADIFQSTPSVWRETFQSPQLMLAS